MDERNDAATGDRASGKTEVVLAILLGLAAVAAGWASYRGSLADGDMIASYNEGIRTVDLASQAYTEANQNLVQDQALFLEFVKAVQSDDEELAEYILTQLMSEDLQAAVAWWQDDEDALTPFVEENPDYHPEAFQRGEELDAEAQARFDQANEADQRGDRFDLIVVVLAVVLFLLGVAAVVRERMLQLGFLIIGAAMLAVSAGAILVLELG